MATYSSLQKEIALLQRQAEVLRKQELASVITGVKRTVAKYSLLASDIFDGVQSAVASAAPASATAAIAAPSAKTNTTAPVASKKAAKKSRAPVNGAGIVKYMDPKTQQTWSGFGRAPAWLAGVKDRTKFLASNVPAAPEVVAPVQAGTTEVAAATVKVVQNRASPAKKAASTAPVAAKAAAKKKAAVKKAAATNKEVAPVGAPAVEAPAAAS